MAVTFTQVEASLVNAGGDIIQARQVYERAVAFVTQADDVLAALATTYAEVIAEINAQAIALPGDVAWQNLKSRLDKIVAERGTLKTTTAAAKAALAAL